MVFLASALIAMVTTLLAFNAGPSVPFALVSWLVTIYAGYRIWRAAHPATSFWRELSRRTVAVVTFGATVAALAFAAAAPQVALVIVGIWFVVIVVLFVMLGLAERTSQ
jgi:hypothetical protein